MLVLKTSFSESAPPVIPESFVSQTLPEQVTQDSRKKGGTMKSKEVTSSKATEDIKTSGDRKNGEKCICEICTCG